MAKKTIKVGLRSTGAEPAAGDVNISYKGSRIAGLSESSTAILETENTIVTGDISVEYNQPSGGDPYDIARKIASGTATEFADNDITRLRGYALAYNANLTNLKVPNVNAVDGNCINGTGITTLVLPKLTTTYGISYAFAEARHLTAADFEKLTNIAVNVFKNDSEMNVLVIRTPTVCACATSAFDGTPFASAGTGGILYVPANLVAEYQAATNWSAILGYTNNQIKSIESTHTDPLAPVDLTLYYVDGTPIPTT